MKFGIIGFGRFGKLWANALLPFGEVCACEKNFNQPDPQAHIKMVSLEEVTQADVVFLLVPISELEACCQQIKSLLKPDALVIDCCSVKVYPAKILETTLSNTQPIIGTHPLFGPDSAQRKGGLATHKIVVCPLRCSSTQQHTIENLFSQMGLSVLNATPDEHDKYMANSQALVHFIGRGLASLNLEPQQIATPDFQALLNINKMVVNDSWRLFLDMQHYNPYAQLMRKKFVNQLLQIEKSLGVCD
ncbi:MAG: prephenate dehydrogenase [Gammaproteobacteria bacterium]